MKRTLALLSLLVCFVVSLSANPIDGVFVCEEDGHIVGTITLKRSGNYIISSRENLGRPWTGHYEIEGEHTLGNTLYIDFYIDGRKHTGQLIYFLEQPPTILFDGLCFVKKA